MQYLGDFVTMRTSKHHSQELNINLTSCTFIMGIILLPHRYRIDLIHTVQDGSVVNCYPHFMFDRITLCHRSRCLVSSRNALSLSGGKEVLRNETKERLQRRLHALVFITVNKNQYNEPEGSLAHKKLFGIISFFDVHTLVISSLDGHTVSKFYFSLTKTLQR